MTIQTVNIGAAPNDGTGDDPRTGISKLNANFTDPANAASKLAQTSPTDTTTDRTLMTDALDADGNVWGASNIEYSNDANGEYWKYPDGRAEISFALSGDSGGFISKTLPFSFAGNYRVAGVSTSSTTNAVISLKVSNKAASSFDFAVVAASGFTNVTCDVIVSGRWK